MVQLQMFVLFILCVTSVVSGNTAVDEGFTLLFTTNDNEFVDIRINFEKNLPVELNGVLVYNGLGVFEMGSRSFTHLFDGLAKLLRIQLYGARKTGKVTSRLLQSNILIDSRLKNDLAPYLLFDGVYPKFNIVQRFLQLIRGIDNLNVNLLQAPRKNASSRCPRPLIAINDYWRTYLVNMTTLETIKRIEPVTSNSIETCGGSKFFSKISSSHPLLDPTSKTEDYLTYITSVNPLQPWFNGHICLMRLSGHGGENAQVLTSWSLKLTPYMHSFSIIAQKIVLLLAHPLEMNLFDMARHAQPVRALRWSPHKFGSALFYNLHSRETYSIPFKDSYYIMHHINGFIDPDDANLYHIDGVAYNDLDFLQNVTIKNLHDRNSCNKIPINGELRRYTFQFKEKSFVHAHNLQILDPQMKFINHLEMPSINEAHRGSFYCFVYGVVLKSDGNELSNVTLAKRDVCGRGRDKVWSLQNHYPSETKFIPSSDAKEEDDGYLLTIVLNGALGHSYIALLDARTMKLINKAWLPGGPLPYRLHGHWYKNSDVET